MLARLAGQQRGGLHFLGALAIVLCSAQDELYGLGKVEGLDVGTWLLPELDRHTHKLFHLGRWRADTSAGNGTGMNGSIGVGARGMPDPVRSPAARARLIPRKGTRESAFLVAGVMSAPNHFEWRHTIRDTWFAEAARAHAQCDQHEHEHEHEHEHGHGHGHERDAHKSALCGGIVLRFIIGGVDSDELEGKLALEALAFGDIVRVPVRDGYKSLIYKLLHFFDWAVMHFRFQFLFRINDDVYADLNSIVRSLRRKRFDGAREKLYFGSVYTGRPIRDPGHKNFVDTRCYRWSLFPPYVHGPYVVLSAAIVNAIVAREASLRSRIIVGCGSLEDMQLGLWLFDPLGPLRCRPTHTAAFVPFFQCHAHAVAVSDLWSPSAIADVHRHRAAAHAGGLCHASLRWMAVKVFHERIRASHVGDGRYHASAALALNSLAITLLMLRQVGRAAAALQAAVHVDPRYTAGRTNLRRLAAIINAPSCVRNGTCAERVALSADTGLRAMCAKWPAMPWSVLSKTDEVTVAFDATRAGQDT